MKQRKLNLIKLGCRALEFLILEIEFSLKIVDLVNFHLLLLFLYLKLTLSLCELILEFSLFLLLFCHLQILIENLTKLLCLSISMLEVWAVNCIVSDSFISSRGRCTTLLGFGLLLGLKSLILCLDFELLFFFLANHTVEAAPPGCKRLNLGYRILLKVFLLLLKLLLFIVQTISALNKIAIFRLQFVYFLLCFSILPIFLFDLLLQLFQLLAERQFLELSGLRLDR